MNIHFDFFENEKLIIHKFTGTWSTEKYFDYIRFSVSNHKEEIINTNKILTDLRNIDLTLAFDDEKKLHEIKKILPISNYTNIHLVIDPLSTVASHIYIKKLKKKAISNINIAVR